MIQSLSSNAIAWPFARLDQPAFVASRFQSLPSADDQTSLNIVSSSFR